MRQFGMLVVVVVGALIGSVAWGQQPLKAGSGTEPCRLDGPIRVTSVQAAWAGQ